MNKIFMDKVEHIKHKIFSQYTVEAKLYTLEDL